MGKKLDTLLRRNFKSSRLNPQVNLAISRLAVLRKQRQVRCSLARADVVQILNVDHHERALIRVEQVIKEQNMLDVFVMMESYCHLLAERNNLIEQEKVCPEELKEAVSSMLYASTRCGEFPELQEMREIFTSRFGKEFVACATELRNNCGVNPKMIQKLSTRQPSLENRLKVLKEIASENNIVLQMEKYSTEENLETEQKQHRSKPVSGGSKAGDNLNNFHDDKEDMEGLSDSMRGARKYKDVAEAAKAAFKSAAYAAEAAKAAVELSRSEFHSSNDQSGRSFGKREVTDEHNTMKSELQTTEENNSKRIEDQNVGVGFEKVNSVQNYNSGSEDDEIHSEERAEESELSKRGLPGFDSDSDEDVAKVTTMDLEVVGDQTRPLETGINFDDSDDENKNEGGRVLLSSTHDTGIDMEPSILVNEDLGSKKSNITVDEDLSERDGAKPNRYQKRFSLRSQVGLKARLRAWKS
ncbi:regulator of Vps4 activity in the MVB pathway protein [Actinidia rufa]|uniref:Regulator of Vps4 activity in the MVB pathway protein n=1 Tax=Actinidia rufa TaxID=165716 RepID=A0A7J0DWQ7_9ERIC|nr:regulator of Vps4 activity in the MVB pathway protein [Actinidia rufa]